LGCDKRPCHLSLALGSPVARAPHPAPPERRPPICSDRFPCGSRWMADVPGLAILRVPRGSPGAPGTFAAQSHRWMPRADFESYNVGRHEWGRLRDSSRSRRPRSIFQWLPLRRAMWCLCQRSATPTSASLRTKINIRYRQVIAENLAHNGLQTSFSSKPSFYACSSLVFERPA
jgi:hypothetical protein